MIIPDLKSICCKAPCDRIEVGGWLVRYSCKGCGGLLKAGDFAKITFEEPALVREFEIIRRSRVRLARKKRRKAADIERKQLARFALTRRVRKG